MPRPDFDALTIGRARDLTVEGPINIELQLCETEQWILREALLDFAETEQSEGVHWLVDKMLAEIASTLIHPVKPRDL